MNYFGLSDDEYDDDDAELKRFAEHRPRRISRRSLASNGYPDASLTSQQESDEETLPGTSAQTFNLIQRGPSSNLSVIAPHTTHGESSEPNPQIRVLAPTQFELAAQIADAVMANQPVIINLQAASRDLQRRMIDFCSGVTYALGGGMERVADHVFLITPANVEHSTEEHQDWQKLA
ncbi:MAG: cell division protein SepF [Nitrososphaerales archaeon]